MGRISEKRLDEDSEGVEEGWGQGQRGGGRCWG